jgi:hypothetical protein
MLLDHLLEAFAPDDGKAADGLVHLEGGTALFCLCGVGGSIEALDAHLLAVFIPADRIGQDETKHEPRPRRPPAKAATRPGLRGPRG